MIVSYGRRMLVVVCSILAVGLPAVPASAQILYGSVVGVVKDGQGASVTYSDTKLFVTTLAAAVARRWPEVASNVVDPGWVPTRMGGPGAPDDLRLGHLTQEWLATSDDAQALTSGGYWYHQARRPPHKAVADVRFQDALLDALGRHTGTYLS